MTKYAPLDKVRELLESGEVAEVGENRVQDAAVKKQALGPLAQRAQWRLIGHLQSNKAKKAVAVFDAVDSIDSVHTAAALDAALDKRLPILVQVKLSERQTQSGVSPDGLASLLSGLAAYPRLDVSGLMAIAPQGEDPRPGFRRMRALFEEHFRDRPGARLSMGMSGDFETAVEEGATMVRIGSTVFQ